MPNFNGVWSLTTQLQYRSDWPVFIQNRGLFFGGNDASSTHTNVIDYIDISSTGNASDFGDLAQTRRDNMAVSSDTRAVAAGGVASQGLDSMEYVTIASTGNASDFGDTTVANYNGSGTGSKTRGLLSLGQTGAGGTYGGIIEYITIASTGDSTDFGDLTVGRAFGSDSAFSSPTRGVFYGGYYQTSGIKTDGTLWTWGRNEDGDMGQNNVNTGHSSPTQIPGTTWSKVTNSSDKGGLATKTDGTLWSWGYNSQGQLGDNTVVSRSSPTQIPGTTWSKVGGGNDATYAMKTDGTLWNWGDNEYGQLAQGNTTYYSSPVQIPGTEWTYVNSLSATGDGEFTVARKQT